MLTSPVPIRLTSVDFYFACINYHENIDELQKNINLLDYQNKKMIQKDRSRTINYFEHKMFIILIDYHKENFIYKTD